MTGFVEQMQWFAEVWPGLLLKTAAWLLPLLVVAWIGALCRGFRRVAKDDVRRPAVTWAGKLIYGVMLAFLIVYASEKPGTNAPPSGAGAPRVMLVNPNGQQQVLPGTVTDDDIVNGWREVSRSTDMFDASVFAKPENGVVWENAQARGMSNVKCKV